MRGTRAQLYERTPAGGSCFEELWCRWIGRKDADESALLKRI